MNGMLGGVHYLPNGGKHITLMWSADLYAILIQTLQDFVTPHSDYPGYMNSCIRMFEWMQI